MNSIFQRPQQIKLLEFKSKIEEATTTELMAKELHDLYGDFWNTRIYCSRYLYSYNVNHTSCEKTRVSDHITIGYRFLKPPAAAASSFTVYRIEFWAYNLIWTQF